MKKAPPQLKFDSSLVWHGARADDWREAVDIAGGLLVDAGCAKVGYAARLIEVIDKYGPYMVIAPNLALVHAQPGSDSVEAGLAAVTFPDGVNFGHAHFDPVGLVIAIVTTSTAEHLDVIAGIATSLERNPELVRQAVRADGAEALVKLIRKALPKVTRA